MSSEAPTTSVQAEHFVSVLGWITLLVSGYALFFGIFFAVMMWLAFKPSPAGESLPPSVATVIAASEFTAATNAPRAATSATAPTAATSETACSPEGLGGTSGKRGGSLAAGVPFVFGAVPLVFGLSLLATAMGLLRRRRWARVAFEFHAAMAMFASLALFAMMACPFLHGPHNSDFPFEAFLIGTGIIEVGVIAMLWFTLRQVRSPSVRAVFGG